MECMSFCVIYSLYFECFLRVFSGFLHSLVSRREHYGGKDVIEE